MCVRACVSVLSGALAVSVRLLHERTNKKKGAGRVVQECVGKAAVSGCKAVK